MIPSMNRTEGRQGLELVTSFRDPEGYLKKLEAKDVNYASTDSGTEDESSSEQQCPAVRPTSNWDLHEISILAGERRPYSCPSGIHVLYHTKRSRNCGSQEY